MIHEGQIKQVPARKRSPPAGNRVDAMAASVTTGTEGDSSHGVAHSFAAKAAPPGDPKEAEIICWNCRGFGHAKVDAHGRTVCPSPLKPRSLTYCINGLENARKKDGQRPARRRMWLKRNGRVNAKAAEATSAYELVEVDENQQVWTTEGSYLGTVSEMSPSDQDIDTVEDESNTASTNSPRDQTIAPAGLASAGQGTMNAESEANAENEMSHMGLVDSDFYSAFAPQTSPANVAAIFDSNDCDNITTAENGSLDLHDECSQPARRHNRPRSLTMLAIVASAAAIAIPHRGLSRVMICAALVCYSSAIPITTTSSRTKSKVTCALLGSIKAQPNELNPQTGMVLDTGATMHVSGRMSLFPKSMISEHRPNIAVEIADNRRCTVKFKGTMKIPVQYRTHMGLTRTHIGYLLLQNALYVPEFGENTLLSPKSMFRAQSTDTHLLQ